MNHRRHWLALASAVTLAVGALSYVGCSSSDSEEGAPAGGAGTGGSAGTGGTGGTAGTGGAGGSGGTAGTGGTGGAGGAASGVCANASDQAATQAAYCPGDKSVADVTSGCAIQCLTATDSKMCSHDCVDTATNHAISGACIDCYVDLTSCGQTNCLTACISDPKSAGCLACLCGGTGNTGHVNCYDGFNACTGLGFQFCEQLDAGTWTGYPPPDGGCATDAGADAEADAGADATPE